MEKIGRFIGLLIFIISFSILFSQTSHAYLDPGSGSYVLQIIIAFFLTGLYVIKLFWNKIKCFFMNLFKRGENE